MFFYPKYLEFADGELLIFDAGRNHDNMATHANRQVLSAGQVSASRADQLERCGRFFGESVTLRLASNASLRLDGRT